MTTQPQPNVPVVTFVDGVRRFDFTGHSDNIFVQGNTRDLQIRIALAPGEAQLQPTDLIRMDFWDEALGISVGSLERRENFTIFPGDDPYILAHFLAWHTALWYAGEPYSDALTTISARLQYADALGNDRQWSNRTEYALPFRRARNLGYPRV